MLSISKKHRLFSIHVNTYVEGRWIMQAGGFDVGTLPLHAPNKYKAGVHHSPTLTVNFGIQRLFGKCIKCHVLYNLLAIQILQLNMYSSLSLQ